MEPPLKRRKVERRVFQPKWELEYFFTQVNIHIYCVICKKQLKNAKSCDLKRHFNNHKEKLAFLRDVDTVHERKKKFEELRAILLSNLNESSTDSSSPTSGLPPDEPVRKQTSFIDFYKLTGCGILLFILIFHCIPEIWFVKIIWLCMIISLCVLYTGWSGT